jgi:hypothetical protein
MAPTLRTIALLARLQLAARRAGVELRLRDPPPGLAELAALSGLVEALRLEPRRQAEEGEERGGVEEEAELDDPAV